MSDIDTVGIQLETGKENSGMFSRPRNSNSSTSHASKNESNLGGQKGSYASEPSSTAPRHPRSPPGGGGTVRINSCPVLFRLLVCTALLSVVVDVAWGDTNVGRAYQRDSLEDNNVVPTVQSVHQQRASDSPSFIVETRQDALVCVTGSVIISIY